MLLILAFIIELVVLVILYFKSRNRYNGLLELIGKDTSILNKSLPIGLYILDLINYKFDTKYDNNIRNRFQELHGSRNAVGYLKIHWAGKVCLVLFLILIIFFFGGIQSIENLINANESEVNARLINNKIQRPNFGEGNQSIVVTAEVSKGKAMQQENYILTIPEMPPKTDKIAVDTAWERLNENLIKGSNQDISHVTTSLKLKENYPALGNTDVSIVWRTADSGIITETGQIIRPEAGEKGKQVKLCAEISKGEVSKLKYFNVTVLPKKPLTDNQSVENTLSEIRIELNNINRLKEYISEQLSLPVGTSQDVNVRWIIGSGEDSEGSPKDYVYGIILFIGFVLVIGYVLDNELKVKIERRRRRIQYEFPDFINKLILLINAGMTVTAAWEKIARESKKNTPLDREIIQTVLDIRGGRPEQQSFEAFAERCRIPEAAKFVSAILQNIKKGNAELVSILRLQSKEFWETRKNIAKRLGEEASTKLLFPMMLILLAILMIVITPAAMALKGF